MSRNSSILERGEVKFQKAVKDAVIAHMGALAEKSIVRALVFYRKWEHRTMNLMDAYGYAIYYNGNLVRKKMAPPKAIELDTEGGMGADRGSDFIDGYIPKFQGWCLVVVNGEFYAEFIDSLKGLDVLTGAFQYSVDNFTNIQFKKIQ